jgi:hypothetical protein
MSDGGSTLPAPIASARSRLYGFSPGHPANGAT